MNTWKDMPQALTWAFGEEVIENKLDGFSKSGFHVIGWVLRHPKNDVSIFHALVVNDGKVIDLSFFDSLGEAKTVVEKKIKEISLTADSVSTH